MKISVIGAGYVGLVTGACLAHLGHTVDCIDIDKIKIEKLKNGVMPIYEPGLDKLVERCVKNGRLNFSTEHISIENSTAIFIAVGTPSSRRGDGYADLTYVYETARQIAKNLKNYAVIIDKSTVPVGTAKQVERIIKEENPEADFDVVSNPEFLREGAAILDFMKPARVVIGARTERAREVMKEVYETLIFFGNNFVFTTPESAEITKYAANAFLATKISFANEMASLCEEVNADVEDVVKGIGLDDRIGEKFLKVGPGYGGSCFPKDTSAYLRIFQEYGTLSRIVEAVVEANNAQKAKMVQKIISALGGNAYGKNISVLGLAFKAETDDMRDAQSITILSSLSEKGAKIKAYDPKAMEEAKKIMPQIEYINNPYDACAKADCVILLTEWDEFKDLDLEKIKGMLAQPIFVDLRNFYDPEKMKKYGFKYYSIGRPTT